jgi:hypothetical protein
MPISPLMGFEATAIYFLGAAKRIGFFKLP